MLFINHLWNIIYGTFMEHHEYYLFMLFINLLTHQLTSLCYGATARELSLYFRYIYVKTT
jgi:hypothetical protein